MEAIISTLVAHHRVADITIEDPPMEQIIAAIYNQAEDEGSGLRAQGSGAGAEAQAVAGGVS
jgi:ABC-2 type transport system ATP-binding protein